MSKNANQSLDPFRHLTDFPLQLRSSLPRSLQSPVGSTLLALGVHSGLSCRDTALFSPFVPPYSSLLLPWPSSPSIFPISLGTVGPSTSQVSIQSCLPPSSPHLSTVLPIMPSTAIYNQVFNSWLIVYGKLRENTDHVDFTKL